MKEAISERRKAFAAAHRSDENRQDFISASRRASSVIAKAETSTCSSLSPKSNPKSVYFIFRSVPGSSSSSPNFPNCSYPRESASVFADHLRSHFSVSQPKAPRSSARGYLSELHQATCPEESHSSFCSPFYPVEFFAAASNLSLFAATGPKVSLSTDKDGYPILKHLSRPGMDFLFHIFNLSCSLHSFPPI